MTTEQFQDEMNKLDDIINTIKQDIDLLGNVQLIIGEKTNVSELDSEAEDKINAFFEQSDIRLIDEDSGNVVDINLIDDSMDARFSILRKIADKEITCEIKQPDEALHTKLRPGSRM